MSPKSQLDTVAVIGAGMAGLSCAVALRSSVGWVTVFEEADQPGGRMSTRCVEALQFDSGAQYLTVRSEAFARQVELWKRNWLLDRWDGWLVDLEHGEAMSREDGVSRYVGRPEMHSCLDDMAEGCDVRYGVSVARLEERDGQWELYDTAKKNLGRFDAVVVAVPAPQAALLLEAAPALAGRAAAVDMTPTWTLMLAFSEPLHLGFDGAFVVGNVLAWLARNSSKVERDSANGEETWVVHAAPEWSEANVKTRPKKVIKTLLAEMEAAVGRPLPEPEVARAELWPYAMPVNPLEGGCLYDEHKRIGACGDWCYAPRVEGAYLSGLAMAARVLHDDQP